MLTLAMISRESTSLLKMPIMAEISTTNCDLKVVTSSKWDMLVTPQKAACHHHFHEKEMHGNLMMSQTYLLVRWAIHLSPKRTPFHAPKSLTTLQLHITCLTVSALWQTMQQPSMTLEWCSLSLPDRNGYIVEDQLSEHSSLKSRMRLPNVLTPPKPSGLYVVSGPFFVNSICKGYFGQII